MAKNISLLGADYPDVPAVVLPKTGGGSAMFVDADDVKNVENALAIVVNGNTAPKAITAGQYLFIKNHSTLATGGYHATANISSGGAVSGSNVAADADGISNAINSKFEGTTLLSNSNLLDAPVGVWSYASATGLSNTPCANGLVRVYKSPSFAWTFIYVNDPTNAAVTYLNIKTGSGWGGWKKYTGVSV